MTKYVMLYEDFINESRNKVPSKVVKIIKEFKKQEGTVYVDTHLEMFENKDGKQYGYRIYDKNGKCFRVNSKKQNFSTISSIDLFNTVEINPLISIDVDKNTRGVGQLLSKSLSSLKNDITRKDMGTSIAISAFFTIAFVIIVEIAKKIGASLSKGKNERSKKTEEQGARSRHVIPEEGSIDLEKIFQGDKSDVHILPTFEKMATYTDMVIDGKQNSLIIGGRAGVGKSIEVLKRFYLKDMKSVKDFMFLKGRSTPAGLYTALYQYKDQIIVFDDCDSVFGNMDSVNILKGALDTMPEREITWRTARPIKLNKQELPQQFIFTGRCIFITNLDLKRIDKALISRSLIHSIELSDSEVILKMKHILPKVFKDMDMTEKEEVLKYIIELNKKDRAIKLNLRTLIKALSIRSTGHPLWKEMVKEQCRNIDE